MKKPAWVISLNNKIVDTRQLISLSVVDNRGMEMDTCTITLSDFDGMLAIPSKGVTLSVQIGYKDEPLVDRGTFIVDDISHTGPPDYLVIGAKSGNLQSAALKSGKAKTWNPITLGAIVDTVAQEHKLKAVIDRDLAKIMMPHLIQNESDIHFLTRLAEANGALAAIKAGNLVFTRVGNGKTASGKNIPTITITRDSEQDVHNWRAADRGRYTGVRAFWGKKTKKGHRGYVDVGADGYRKHMPHIEASKAEAARAAQAEWVRLNQKLATMELQLANANPALFAETPIKLTGWDKPEIDGVDWIVTKVTLDVGASGLSAKAILEVMRD